MPDDPKRDTPVPGTAPAPQNGSRLAAGREGDREAREAREAQGAAAARQRGQRTRHIDCSPGDEAERPSSDGHGRHR